MKILVANLGSTSFKYRLFDMREEQGLAHGGVERIGSGSSRCYASLGERKVETVEDVADHGAALARCLDQLTDKTTGCLRNPGEVSAIGFKAVHGGRITGVRPVDAGVLAAMEEVAGVDPAHNPPYVAAMRLLAERVPEIPLVVAFETGFHETIPEANRLYAVPWEWAE